MTYKLIDQLKYEEGLRLNAYICPAGYLTIGYGHNLEAMPRFNGTPIAHTIDKALAKELLIFDLQRTSKTLIAAWPPILELDQARRDACYNMAFQLGPFGFMRFKRMREALRQKDWAKAKAEALDSKWAREDSPARAERVAEQLLTGDYYEVPAGA